MSKLRVLFVLALLAVPAILIAEDALQRYQVDPQQAENSVLASVRGWWDAPDVSDVLRALPADQRAEAVQALGGFVKGYVQSEDFKKAYGKAYKDSKPKRGFGLPSINVKKMAEDAATKQVTGEDEKKQGLDKDPNVTIKARLREFLKETEDIDYGAATIGQGNGRRFSEAANEAKPPLWKMGFRAGKETTEAAREFAKQWLSELP
jgi:hypothetical protein